jgi:outer membrane beta-barrel protein
MHRSSLATLTLSLLAALAGGARAEGPVIYGPDGAPTVVQNKLYTMTGRLELGFSAATAFNGALVDHYGASLELTHHSNEWLDFGGELLGNYAALSGLADQVRDKLPARGDSTTHKGNINDEIANTAQLRAGALGLIRLAPFYGKFNLASEASIHFQAYGSLGLGAGLFHHESVNLCATSNSGSGACPNGYLTSDALRPMGTVAAGLRFYLGERWSIRSELRVNLFPDTVREGADLTVPSSGTDRTYIGVLTMFALGISRLF